MFVLLGRVDLSSWLLHPSLGSMLQVGSFQVSGDLLVLTSVRLGSDRPWWPRLRDLSNSWNRPTPSFAPGGHRRIVTAPGRDLSTFRQYRTPSVAPGGHRRVVTAPGRDLSTSRRCYTHSFTPGGHGRVVTTPGRDLSTPRRITLTYLAKPKLGWAKTYHLGLSTTQSGPG